MSLTKLLQYTKDVAHAVLNFQTGLTRRDVVEGYFTDDELGKNQELFYNSLLKYGFNKTAWQVVFSDESTSQTAGLVKKLEEPIQGMDEIHVRFYDDGSISAELEHGRWSFGHWREKRRSGNEELTSILYNEIYDLVSETKDAISEQITDKNFDAVSPNQYPDGYVGMGLAKAFLCVQYPVTLGFGLANLFAGEFYFAMEPLGFAAVETPLVLGMFMKDRPDEQYNGS